MRHSSAASRASYRAGAAGRTGVGKGTQAECSATAPAPATSPPRHLPRRQSLAEGERSPALESALGYMNARPRPRPDRPRLIAERTGCLRLRSRISARRISAHGPAARPSPKSLNGKNFARRRPQLRVPIEKIVARLSGRRTCPKCKAVFHVTTLRRASRASATIADQTRASARTPARSGSRAHGVYDKSTKPLIDFYRNAACCCHRGQWHAGGNLPAHLTALGSLLAAKRDASSGLNAD